MDIRKDQDGEFSRLETPGVNRLVPGHVALPGSVGLMELAEEPETAAKAEIEQLVAQVAFRLPLGERESYIQSVRAAFPVFN